MDTSVYTSVDTSVDTSVFMDRASFTFWLKVVWPCKNYFSKTTLLLSLSCENDVASQLVVFSCFVRSADPEQTNMASGRRSRSRSRSSAPHTPSTPSDAGQVSGEDDKPEWYWGNSHAFASFRLLRGDWICESDYTKVYRLFPNLKPESCVLTVVILRK